MFGLRPFGHDPFGGAPDPAQAQTRGRFRMRVGSAAAYPLRLNSGLPFITGGDDEPAWTPFDGGLINPLSYRAGALSSDGVVSGFGAGEGEVAIDNSEGRHNVLIGAWTVDGQEQEIRLGSPHVPFRDWFTVFRGTARSLHVDGPEVRIRITDYGHRLDQPLQTGTYAGTGGAEGGEDLKGKRRPRALGYVYNATAPQVDTVRHVFQVSDGPCQAITAYLNGSPQTPGGDYPSWAALVAQHGATEPGKVYTCLAGGWAMLHALPDSAVPTFDIEGENAGAFAATESAIVRRMARTVLPAALLFQPAFAAFDAVGAYEAGYWAGHESEVTVREAIAQMMGAGSWAFFTRLGQLAIAQLAWPAGPPVARFDDADLISVRREPLPDGVAPPPWQVKVGWGRNETPMTANLAGVISPERRAFLAEQTRWALAQDETIRRRHPSSQVHSPAGRLRGAGGAAARAARLLALHRRPAGLWRFRVGRRGFRVDSNDVVHLRSGVETWLAAGRLVRVIDRQPIGRDQQVEFVGFG